MTRDACKCNNGAVGAEFRCVFVCVCVSGSMMKNLLVLKENIDSEILDRSVG